MATVGLVGCVHAKRRSQSKACDLYCSPLFIKCREFVERHCDKWYILSARHGLIEPSTLIAPYDETLHDKNAAARQDWARMVWEQLRQRVSPKDHVVFLAGQRYRQYLLPMVSGHGCTASAPLQGLRIGHQLHWLDEQKQHEVRPRRSQDLERFYRALTKLEDGLGGTRLLRDCTARDGWPARGVYLFFEPGEARERSAVSRVVRVGTHGVSRGSKSTLWQRLRAHRGTVGGPGNHRGSIFRLHVGAALAARESGLAVASWGEGQSAAKEITSSEQDLETRVSEHVGAMSILWLAIEDDSSPFSDRAYIERNLIGLLTGKEGPIDTPSNDWLGRFSREARIRHSGLWNLDFLEYDYAPESLDVFEAYVAITVGERSQPSRSIAPADWHAKEPSRPTKR